LRGLVRPILAALLVASLPATTLAADSCRDCHAQLEPALKAATDLMGAKDVHAKAGLSCVDCHGGDATSSTKHVAHGKGFTGKPVSAAVATAMCGKCHAKPAENYAKGPHHVEKAGRNNPRCYTCHGAHGVQTASIDLIAEPLCTTCHTFPQASRIHKALRDAEREISELDSQLPASNPARAKLKEARGELRGMAHALDLFTVTRDASHALEVVDQVRATELPKVKARAWVKPLRIAALVLTAVMLLLAAGIAARFVWAHRHHIPVVGKLGRAEWKILGIAGGALAIAGGIVAWRGNRYIEHEPRFCLSCHTMNSAYDLWEQSGHKNIECHACHVPNTVSNLKQLWVYTTQRPDVVVRHAEVDRGVCEKCHTGGSSAAKKNHIADTPGHRIHAQKARIECVLCHSTSLHRFKPPRDMCVQCHKQITLAAAGTMAEMHCLQCHPFMADDAKRPLKPDRALCLDCHQNRQIKGEVFPAKAPMKWDCGKCHKPHEKIRLANADCVKCHDAINEGLHQVKAHVDDCQGCHKPHSWSSGVASCAQCHEKIDPASHHPGKGACTECHGAWNDNWVKLAQLTRRK
jgi:NapC/NirT cytochrome c family protein/cytochrome c3-like protein